MKIFIEFNYAVTRKKPLLRFDNDLFQFKVRHQIVIFNLRILSIKFTTDEKQNIRNC